MTSRVWQLEKHQARLQLGQLRGAIDLSRPAQGLASLVVDGTSFGDARLLGLDVPSPDPGGPGSLIEAHVRGGDLIAAYHESEDWPIRVDTLWRAVRLPASSGAATAIELVVSVGTESLESRPGLSVRSVLPAAGVLRLVDRDPPRFETVGREEAGSIAVGNGLGCVVFRLPGVELSYVEMVHPTDYADDVLEGAARSGAAVCLAHRLFAEPLERGVILRARVRGGLVPRGDDARLAAECYTAFAEAEPPLEA